MVQRLPLLLCLVASFIATASPMQCNFGSTTPEKASAPPPPPPREGITLTCNPPHPVGKGTVTLDSMMMEGKEKEEDGYSPSPTTTSSSPYIDAQIFSYASDPSPLLPAAVSATPTRRASLVKVAALALGADGGCATGACSPSASEYCPPGYPGHPTSKANGTQRIIDYLNEAGESGVDLAVLPENAFGRPGMDASACYHAPEPVDGESVKTVQALAKKWKMNVVLPLHEVREAGGGDGGAATKMYNTAVVINRAGETVGTYSKVFPVFGNTSQTVPPTVKGSGEVAAPDLVTPATTGVQAFDLDFGRIAVVICYDINFAELWMQASALNADIVVWPSAMQTPDPSSYGYARIFQYDIIAVGFPGDIVDRTGTQHPNIIVGSSKRCSEEEEKEDGEDGEDSQSLHAPDPKTLATAFPMMRRATVDVDRTFVHWDYNSAKVKRLLKEHPEVVVEVPGPPFYLLKSTSNTTSVKELLKAYKIETNREYITRSRQGLNMMRQMH